jgi:unsaturated rhamnogalacturonyl hydrolase
MIKTEKADRIIQTYIERLILPSPPLQPLWNCENMIFSKKPKWNYIDSCMINAVIMMYELSGDERLYEYVRRFVDSYVDENGQIPTLNISDYNLDNIAGGRNLLFLFGHTHEEKYLIAAGRLFSQLKNQPRLKCGNFFHKAVYPYQIWLDGTYMSFPFMIRYAVTAGESSVYGDVLNQLENIRRYMKDGCTGLYYHAYDESRSSFWSDSDTGLSEECWLRSIGWYCAALADIYELSDDKNLCDFCRISLSELLTSLSGYITDGMLYQLPSKPELHGNYPETSGTLLFSYAALKGYRSGICSGNIKEKALESISAITEKYITFSEDGLPILKNICLMAGLGGESRRNGSAVYYLSEPVVENDAKGIAPYFMAYTEMIQTNLQKQTKKT